MIKPEWIAVDWGTTHLRVWAMQGNAPVAQAASDKGMGCLKKDDFEGALVDLIGDWLSEPVTAVACGMVGSRQGWVEAPYHAAPCSAHPHGFVSPQTKTPNLTVKVIPGIKQTAPADVMRGEETQIAGFLALNPDWDGVLCLPGTHTKWVHVSAGEVVSFQTFMTGELFALISGQSVLRHSLSADGWDQEAFDSGFETAMARPERGAAHLFGIRAEALLNGLDGTKARARLSGLLIGAEIAATKPYWLGQTVGIIGANTLAGYYASVLRGLGVPTMIAPAQEATLAGLAMAWASLKG